MSLLKTVGFTGTQNGCTRAQLARLYLLLREYEELHHGDCVGADAQAHSLAVAQGMRVFIHPCLSG